MALTPEVMTGELKGTFSILDYTLSVSVDNLSTGMLVSCNLKYLTVLACCNLKVN